jgi:arabinose-5-phosphate isomerase
MSTDFDFLAAASAVFDAEISSLQKVQRALAEPFNAAVTEILQSSGRVVLCGIGKSGYIARKIFATLVSTGTPSFFMHPGEACHGDLGMVLPDDIFLFISNSGETNELLMLVPFIQDNGNKLIAMTGNAESSLARVANHHIPVVIDQEACPLQLAPTSSTTAALVMGDALAMVLMQARQFKAENFARFHPGGSLGRKLIRKVRDEVRVVPFVSASTNIRECVASLAQSGVGLICVGSSSEINGVFTDGDLRRALYKYEPNQLFSMNVSQVMTTNPKTVPANMRCHDADEMMKQLGVNSLLVIDSGNVLGVYQNLNNARSLA